MPMAIRADGKAKEVKEKLLGKAFGDIEFRKGKRVKRDKQDEYLNSSAFRDFK